MLPQQPFRQPLQESASPRVLQCLFRRVFWQRRKSDALDMIFSVNWKCKSNKPTVNRLCKKKEVNGCKKRPNFIIRLNFWNSVIYLYFWFYSRRFESNKLLKGFIKIKTWIIAHKRRKALIFQGFSKGFKKATQRWSYWPDSNRRPADYESAALPTEPQ